MNIFHPRSKRSVSFSGRSSWKLWRTSQKSVEFPGHRSQTFQFSPTQSTWQHCLLSLWRKIKHCSKCLEMVSKKVLDWWWDHVEHYNMEQNYMLYGSVLLSWWCLGSSVIFVHLKIKVPTWPFVLGVYTEFHMFFHCSMGFRHAVQNHRGRWTDYNRLPLGTVGIRCVLVASQLE